MKSCLKVVTFFATLVSCYSQNNTLSGKIYDGSELLPYAHVYIKNLNLKLKLGTSSDNNGFYLIEKIPKGTHTITVGSLGYKTRSLKFTFEENKKISLDFSLISDNTLDEIIVTGTLRPVTKSASPVPVDVYGQHFFKKNPNPSIFESLQNINGVRPQLNCNVCNTGDIRINGLEGPYTFVLIDGMPLVSGLSTVYGLTGIPQALIEKIEIVKGPASTLYGSEAVGGILNIITKKPSNSPRIVVDNFSSSWAEINADLGFQYKMSKKIHALLGIQYFNYQKIIDKNNDLFTDLALQNRISLFNKLNIERKGNKKFTIAFRYMYEDRWGGETRWKKSFRGSDQIYGESIFTSRWETFGTYEFSTVENVRFQFSVNGHYQDSFYGLLNYNANQLTAFGQFLFNKEEIKNHNLLLGLTYRYTFYDDNTFGTFESDGITNKPSIVHLPGIFIQDEINVHKRKKLLLGIRYDYNSLHGMILSPRINYKWNFNETKSTLRFSLGNGFRIANVFTEDHAALTGAREVEFDGELSPETSWNANVNYVKKIAATNTSTTLDASIFYTYFNNRILPDYETDPNKIIYANLDGFSVSKGVSLNSDILFQNGFAVNIGATLMDVSITENNTRRHPLLTEKFSGVWTLSKRFKTKRLKIDYTGNVYSPMGLPRLSDSDPRSGRSPWFSIQNIQLTKKFANSWELYGGVKNFLNFTPPDNSIARSFDPFDTHVLFDSNGQAVATPDNPNALTFDPSYVYASNQGIRGFLGLRYTLF